MHVEACPDVGMRETLIPVELSRDLLGSGFAALPSAAARKPSEGRHPTARLPT